MEKKIKCIKDFYPDYYFDKDSFYTIANQNNDFCVMITKGGQRYAFTRNKINHKLIHRWIEDYFDYSSPIITRKVIIEKQIF